MNFKKVICTHAFYDEDYGEIFYSFDTVPQIGHGEWAISRGGDTVYDLLHDRVMQGGYPEELNALTDYIPDDIEIEGFED